VRISDDEFAARRSTFAEALGARGLAGAVLFDPQYVHYYTGFFFIPTERPIVFAVSVDGRGGMLVPRLELEHAQANTAVSEVAHYDEYETRASNEATAAMLDAIGPIYRGQSPYYSGAMARYRGQIGRNAAIPHAHGNNIVFQPGDVLVTGASAPVWGYHSELERTMVIGRPTDEQKRLFDHMHALQTLAVDAIRPGLPCAEVDRVVRAYYDEHELWEHWRHHVGHAVGMRYHEGPFLHRGDPTEIRPGMVFTVEPGLYSPSVGGFRHSDTIAVTEDGVEWLTYYPRDLESLTL
jgi:Xaa-Pro dipeptidase